MSPIIEEFGGIIPFTNKNNAFDLLDKLVFLYLSNNIISEIGNNAFKSLESLTYLDLNNNKIPHISIETFGSLSNLKYLILSRNKIAKIENNAFDFLKILEKLDLSQNQIPAIEDFLFQHLVNLEILSISPNPANNLNKDSCLSFPSHRSFNHSIIESSSKFCKNSNNSMNVFILFTDYMFLLLG